LSHGVTESGLDLFLVSSLHLERHAWVGDDFLDAGDVGFKLLPGFESLAEGFVAGLEFRGV
jgi:hypothetical protein